MKQTIKMLRKGNEFSFEDKQILAVDGVLAITFDGFVANDVFIGGANITSYNTAEVKTTADMTMLTVEVQNLLTTPTQRVAVSMPLVDFDEDIVLYLYRNVCTLGERLKNAERKIDTLQADIKSLELAVEQGVTDEAFE